MNTPNTICKDGASKSNRNDVSICEMNDMLQNMSTADKDVSVCANCGKEGSDVTNTCNKCKMVKYCNAACKKKHRHKHKKQCEEHIKLVAEKHNEELRIAAELHDIELFKQPPPIHEDCPICFERMPIIPTGSKYKACCGKLICSGCMHAPVYDHQGNKVIKKCPFCRTPKPKSNEEIVERGKKRVEAGDPYAIYDLGCDYRDGTNRYPQDYTKALELWHRAGELGYSSAYHNIGNAYYYGRGVEVDKQKAKRYHELAAMGGCETARHSLGLVEEETGNMDRALKHYTIAIRGGYSDSLRSIKQLYADGHATKDDYTKALQVYQAYLGEIKSAQRDEAAAANNRYRYY